MHRRTSEAVIQPEWRLQQSETHGAAVRPVWIGIRTLWEQLRGDARGIQTAADDGNEWDGKSGCGYDDGWRGAQTIQMPGHWMRKGL